MFMYQILGPAGKSMEDLKVINRKIRETVSNPFERFKRNRNVSRTALLPEKQQVNEGNLWLYYITNTISEVCKL